jgi:regulator of replication initiation timing
MTTSEKTVDEVVNVDEELHDRVSKLEAETERLREENERLHAENAEFRETIKLLGAKLKQYENAHTPPSQQHSGGSDGDEADCTDQDADQSADSESDDEESEACTDGGTVGRTSASVAPSSTFRRIRTRAGTPMRFALTAR